MSSPPAGWIRLNSQDGYSFVIPKTMAEGSEMIKSSLAESDYLESKTNTIFVNQRGLILARIVEYLAYKEQYGKTPTKDISEDFSGRIEPEVALELLMAADYMQI